MKITRSPLFYLSLCLLCGVGALVLYLRRGYEEALAPVAGRAPVASTESESQAAERLAATHRASLELRWRKARSIAVEKWRADLLTANAIGEIGAAPPMLRVHETGTQVQLTNRGAEPLCVALSRVTRPDTDAVQRCRIGPERCSLVKPGATIRLQILRNGATEACQNAAFEYRVGNVDFPEPSWWSRSAINEFDDPPHDIGYKDDADLQADIARFEATVEDADRAARWRRDIAR
jgi:hypothetical protein